MTSKLIADLIQAPTGEQFKWDTSQGDPNVEEGLVLAWFNYVNDTNVSPTNQIRGSFNISTILDAGTGTFNVTLASQGNNDLIHWFSSGLFGGVAFVKLNAATAGAKLGQVINTFTANDSTPALQDAENYGVLVGRRNV